jgi:glutamate dehydrogenase
MKNNFFQSNPNHYENRFKNVLTKIGACSEGKPYLSTLANEFFNRISYSYLNLHTDDYLTQLLLNIGEKIELFLSNKDKKAQVAVSLLPTIDKNQNSSCLTIITYDRPFIVRSITELLTKFGIDAIALLHPVLKIDRDKLSVVYLELNSFCETQRNELILALKTTLEDLINVTEDFPKMLEALDKLKHNLSLNNDLGSCELIDWLKEDNFLFVGVVNWEVEQKTLQAGTGSLGIFRNSNVKSENLKNSAWHQASRLYESSKKFSLAQLATISPIQKGDYLEHFIFQFEKEGRLGFSSIIGLFTDASYRKDCRSIPLIREKVDYVIKFEEAEINSYDYKFIIKCFNEMPKTILFGLESEKVLKLIRSAIGINSHISSRIEFVSDEFEDWIYLLISLPKESFSLAIQEKIQKIIEKNLDSNSIKCQFSSDLSADLQAKLYVAIPTQNLDFESINFAIIEAEILDILLSWTDRLENYIFNNSKVVSATEVMEEWSRGKCFSTSYQEVYSYEDAWRDLNLLNYLNENEQIKAKVTKLYKVNQELKIELSLYSKQILLPIHKTLPILDNLGLKVEASVIYPVESARKESYFIHRFTCSLGKKLKNVSYLEGTLQELRFTQGLEMIVLGKMENDALDSLLLSTPTNINFTPNSIALFRAYSAYLWQIIKYATRGTIYNTLAEAPEQTSLLWQIFEHQFNPTFQTNPNLNKDIQKLSSDFYLSLKNVKNATKDQILRAIHELIISTVRTNFYSSGVILPIALKFHAAELDLLSPPRPLYEIFIRSTEFEAIHLRSAKTARGGIRWSDRKDDFRNEILGLMKTQVVKNVIIVPSGAKGGFAVRQLPDNFDDLKAKVEGCYKDYIRSLLSITDNIVGGKIIHPKGVIIKDEEDPYFVVAADKGTATFSDLANKIAIDEFNFWLGDAFASGGSNGYDHKLYGITARGAWESVKRNFKDIGIDFIQSPFSVVGIGDMSGDVFGNGLLYSKNIKLIAAFNHKHIFLDPNPNLEQSFAERSRLFKLVRSQWSDYNCELISKGGGVFDRFAKEILISNEVRAALDLPPNVPNSVTGENLIKLILQSNCDLLWNGGIGTYVKASSEGHSEVQDSTNDQVRINANQLRAKVVAEGGNLGFTAKARVEYASLGGKINSDAIDNSGGVDLSDHEVNIKLALAPAVTDKRLILSARNQLLLEIVDEVIEAVLSNNRNQATILTLALNRSITSIHYFQSHFRELEKLGFIDRGLDKLPTAEELSERAHKKIGLYRPELATCLAATKMWIKQDLLKSNLVNDPLLEHYLLSYFPKKIREKFLDLIIKHPLRKEIIAAQATNQIIDSVGITFIHRNASIHSASSLNVIKSVIAAEILLSGQEIRDELTRLDTIESSEIFLILRAKLSAGIRKACTWIVVNHSASLPLDQIVELYRASYASIILKADILTPECKNVQSQIEEYKVLGLKETVARKLAVQDEIANIFNILSVSRLSKSNIESATHNYFMLLEALKLKPFLDLEDKIALQDRWEYQLVAGSLETVRSHLVRLGVSVNNHVGGKNIDKDTLLTFLTSLTGYPQLIGAIEEILIEGIKPSSLAVVSLLLASI